MALLNGRAGRLKSQNGDFRPGQCVRLYWRNSVTERKNKQESRFVSAEGWCTHLRDIFCPSRERKLQLDVINFMSDRCYDIQHHVMPKDPQVIAAQRGKTNTNVSVYHQMRIALNESYLLDQVLPPSGLHGHRRRCWAKSRNLGQPCTIFVTGGSVRKGH